MGKGYKKYRISSFLNEIVAELCCFNEKMEMFLSVLCRKLHFRWGSILEKTDFAKALLLFGEKRYTG
ncbi:hypothetical protein BMT55_04150 [Listeria newyorkensis]|uniref:Uncharacterized protein n=1 Tax=Listeria newyorkensis TaxID=1497681 RepID=A0ABX4XW78_9LIST|nr:hypothetical protein EP56_11425 [Listeriaceae bacterium FSL A5-0209]KGL41916.1 hypothetical protein EP58_10255 [Listeria newyorkensis]KMT58580.1 hypothetical protein X559_3009 [Listeria newyorkensis]PNP93965.1 hypothetical protein BMT55_04150 [Listeria newyorkensis]RQW67449.1 hypothetical protein DUK53_06770 [Listeria sp. SHR_NRA_18]